jgi:hypothetical protein
MAGTKVYRKAMYLSTAINQMEANLQNLNELKKRLKMLVR